MGKYKEKPCSGYENEKVLKEYRYKNHQIPNEGSKRGGQKQRNYKTVRKQNGNINLYPFTFNYFKCKWIKLFNKTHRGVEWIFKK
jgi:hypothetical protein